MDINKQITKLKNSIFEKDLDNFKETINDSLNAMITKYEFESKRVLTIEQRKKGKLLILQEKILPIIIDPIQKSIIFALIGEFKD